MKNFQVKILEVNKKTDEISEFVLGFDSKIDGEFDFKHGQFLTVNIDVEKILDYKDLPDGVVEKIEKIKTRKNKIIKRAYSIVDVDTKEGKIYLWIKNEKGIGTKFLFSKKIGETLDAMGGMGHFFVKGEKDNLFFSATGIGIPPIISHLKFIFEKNKKLFENKKIFFAYGIRHKKDFFCEKILKKFAEENKNFSYKIFFSREENILEEEKNFRKGYFTKFFEEEKIDFKNSEFYFCGGLSLVKEIGDILEKNSVDRKNFFFEAY